MKAFGEELFEPTAATVERVEDEQGGEARHVCRILLAGQYYIDGIPGLLALTCSLEFTEELHRVLGRALAESEGVKFEIHGGADS